MKRFSLILIVLSMLAVMVSITSAQDRPERQNVRGGVIREVLEAASAETGLPISDILSALQADGASLADVIEANGGSVDAVVAVAVQSATERINQAVTDDKMTQERADNLLSNLERLVTDGINGNLPRQDGNTPVRNAVRVLFTSVTDATGMDAQTIFRELRDGNTLADLITANGSTVDAVVASAMEAATEHVNQMVANERITQEQADEMLINLEQIYTDILNGEIERPFMDGRFGGRDGEGRAPVIGVIRQMMEQTGLTVQDILPLLRDGATPAEILTDNGVDVDAFVDDLMVNAQDRLAQAVENDRLTQEQADERLDTIHTTLVDRLNSPVQGRGMMPPEGDPGN